MVLGLDLPGGGALALARSLRSQPKTCTVRTFSLVPRGASVPDDASGSVASLMVAATTFALLRKVDALLADGQRPEVSRAATARIEGQIDGRHLARYAHRPEPKTAGRPPRWAEGRGGALPTPGRFR